MPAVLPQISQLPTPHRLWSIDIDPVTMAEAVDRVSSWICHGGSNCRFVVTPNVDHLVQLYRNPELLRTYRQASLTLADGWPLVTMSRMFGKPLPERVPGSDLLPEICLKFNSLKRPLKVFLLGGRPGVPEKAAKAMKQRWSMVDVVGTASPSLGFTTDPVFNTELCSTINRCEPDLLVVGLGFPKQESWIVTYRDRLRMPVALAVGGTIDFLAGEQVRAPHWIQSMRMEWLHRLATNPRRLAKRYALDAIYFPWICFYEALKKAEAC